MKRVIFGLTDLADVLFYELKKGKVKIDCFCANKEYVHENWHMGKPVVAFEDLDSFLGEGGQVGIYLCLGYHSMNQIREKIYGQIKEKGYEILSFVHDSAIVEAAELGEGCIILEQVMIGPYTKIGNANIFYPKSMVSHHSVVGNYNFFAISASVSGNVIVEDKCFIGNNVTTKDGITIKSLTLAGAGSYIDRDTKKGSCIVPVKSVELKNYKSVDFL